MVPLTFSVPLQLSTRRMTGKPAWLLEHYLVSPFTLSPPHPLNPHPSTGAGMFVTTIVVGAVTISKSFTLTQRPFLRDLIFYMAAVYWTFYLLWNGSVDIGNAAGGGVCVCVCVCVCE